MDEDTLKISEQSVQSLAGGPVCAQQVSVEVANKDAQLVTFEDAQGDPLSWEQIAQLLVLSEDFRSLWNQTWADLPFIEANVQPRNAMTVSIAPHSCLLRDRNATQFTQPSPNRMLRRCWSHSTKRSNV
ncbi:MAG: hypothetical protein AAFO84_17045, partial [Cyanobacteria bacterium J06598_1]